MSGTVVILGATGRFGRHAAEAFWNRGWRVRLFDRSTDDLNEASADADVIVNAWNPPYTAWKKEVPALTARVIEAARASGAMVVIPGNVYVYGEGSPALLQNTTLHRAENPLGRVRIEMEAAYRAAGVKTLILRAGDFIDTEASGNWFDLVITSKLNKGKVVAPGDPDVSHAWAYLPDMARAAVDLVEKRDELATFEEVLFPGFTLSLSELADLIAAAKGREVKLTRLNWLPLRLLSLVWPMGAKLLEMRYLWDMPHRLDGDEFLRLLPNFRTSDPLTAIANALGQLDVNPNQPVARGGHHIAAE